MKKPSLRWRTAASQMTAVDASLVLFNSDIALLKSTLKGLTIQGEIRCLRVLLNDVDESLKRAALDCLREFPTDRLEIVDKDANLGFAAGHNMLLRDSFENGAGHCLIVNPDLALHQGALSKLLRASEEVNEHSIVSGVLLLGRRGSVECEDEPRVDSRGIMWTDNARHMDQDHGMPMSAIHLGGALRKVSGITGALMLVPRFAWLRIQDLSGEFFDEDFFAYREDAELGLRATMLGVDMFVLDDVVGTHSRGSLGTSRDNSTVNRLSVRNRFLIASKYGIAGRPGRLVPTLGRDVLTVMVVVLKEWDSFAGLTQAWRLRARMAEKKRGLSLPVADGRRGPGPRSV